MSLIINLLLSFYMLFLPKNYTVMNKTQQEQQQNYIQEFSFYLHKSMNCFKNPKIQSVCLVEVEDLLVIGLV